MRTLKFRWAAVFVLVAAMLSLGTVMVPGASAAVGDLQVALVNQPADAGVGDLITAAPFDPTGGTDGFVQVHVTQTVLVCDEFETCHEENQDLQGAEVSFDLSEDSPTGTLNVISRFTNADGIATFAPECTGEGESQVCDNPLSIATANNPFTTAYKLVPVAAAPVILLSSAAVALEGTTGPASDPFDIWDDGCHGAGCNINVRNGNESYTAGSNVGLGASVVPLGTNEINCPTQRIIFGTSLFFHATTGDGTDTVFLVTHITREDMKNATNNGQKHVGWCIGLKDSGPWEHNGAVFDDQVVGGQTFFVALAPKCPRRNAEDFAPCFVRKMSDDDGGSIIQGWVLGGDPPRRT